MPSRLSSGNRASQVWNASGEATEQVPLPQEYIANPPATSPLSDHLSTPTDHTSFVPGQPNAVVRRWPRMNGMRYLYASGLTKMPITRNSADGPPLPWVSSFQQYEHGPIHNAGFNDALYQAGYPGFNLGLSFKVPSTPDRNVTQQASANVTRIKLLRPVSYAVNRLNRGSGGNPPERD